MTINPARLYREILAAGIPVTAFAGCRDAPRLGQDDGLPPERWAIDWTSPPTPAQLATAAAVLAAHDPDADEREESAARARLALLADRLESGAATAGEVREALAKMVRRHLGGR